MHSPQMFSPQFQGAKLRLLLSSLRLSRLGSGESLDMFEQVDSIPVVFAHKYSAI